MHIRWLRKALADLGGIPEHIAAANPPAARRVIAAIRNEANVLRSRPNIGRVGRMTGTRELVVARHPSSSPIASPAHPSTSLRW